GAGEVGLAGQHGLTGDDTQPQAFEHANARPEPILRHHSGRSHHSDDVAAPDALRLSDRRGPQSRAHLSSPSLPVNEVLQERQRPSNSEVMRPSAAQITRVAEALVRRLLEADLVALDVPEERAKERFAALLTRNFDDEEAIEREAMAEAEKLVRQGAPGVRREDLDLRRVEQLVKQRLAKARWFVL